MSERARDSLRGRWDTLSNKRQGGRKLRQPWTKKEDDALASEVLEHGTNWKDILENNRTFQAKYGHMKGECQGINTKRRIQYATHPTLFPFSLSLSGSCSSVEKARGALKDRWQTVRPSYDHVGTKKTATSKTGARNPLSAITGNNACTRTQNKPQAIKRRRKKLGREVALQKNRFSNMILLGI